MRGIFVDIGERRSRQGKSIDLVVARDLRKLNISYASKVATAGKLDLHISSVSGEGVDIIWGQIMHSYSDLKTFSSIYSIRRGDKQYDLAISKVSSFKEDVTVLDFFSYDYRTDRQTKSSYRTWVLLSLLL